MKSYARGVKCFGDRQVNRESSKDQVMTQFCRGLYELNITLIYANSPQAKGRVERANKTLQDRLVKELRIRGISDIESANNFMPEFIQDFNQRFEKPPISPINNHRELQPYENIDESLCYKTERTLTINLTVQHDRVQYLIEDNEENRTLKREKIVLHEYPDGTISLYYKNRKLNYRKIYDRVTQVVQADIISNKRIDETLALIKTHMPQMPEIRRSCNAPRKRNLGYDYLTPKERAQSRR